MGIWGARCGHWGRHVERTHHRHDQCRPQDAEGFSCVYGPNNKGTGEGVSKARIQIGWSRPLPSALADLWLEFGERVGVNAELLLDVAAHPVRHLVVLLEREHALAVNREREHALAVNRGREHALAGDRERKHALAVNR